jgi:hypothetical protein
MTSLSDVYEGGVSTVADPRQRAAGLTLFAAGVVAVVAAIALATTGLRGMLGLDIVDARWYAGVLAGLGVPAGVVGVFVVLPASDRTRAAAAIGASIAAFGVVCYGYAYPDRWFAADPAVALATTLIYAVGVLLTFWCLFVGLATFKRRNDPGGTARVAITEEGNVRVVSTGSEPSAFGSVGMFGSDPDGSVPTQTNADAVSSDGGTQTTQTETATQPEPTSDGSGAVTEDAIVDDELLEAAKQRGSPDRYCGNCSHFEYVRADGEITPYCARYDELMDDMDACEAWEENDTPSEPL